MIANDTTNILSPDRILSVHAYLSWKEAATALPGTHTSHPSRRRAATAAREREQYGYPASLHKSRLASGQAAFLAAKKIARWIWRDGRLDADMMLTSPVSVQTCILRDSSDDNDYCEENENCEETAIRDMVLLEPSST